VRHGSAASGKDTDTDVGAHSSKNYETAAQQGSVKFPEILGWLQKYRSQASSLKSAAVWDIFWIMCVGMGMKSPALNTPPLVQIHAKKSSA
jgi:hypothetical protein